MPSAGAQAYSRGLEVVPLFRGDGSPSNRTKSPGSRQLYSLPSDILIHPAVWPQYMGRKVGSVSAPAVLGRGGQLGAMSLPPSNTMWPGPRPTSLPSGILVHRAVWPQQTLAENWGVCPFGGANGYPFWGRRAVSPSNTVLPLSRPTSVPSFILIHPIVWPQYTNVSSRQTGRQSDSWANRCTNGRKKIHAGNENITH